MTVYTFAVVVPANNAAPVNLAAAAIAAGAYLGGSVNSIFSATYLPACRLNAQMARGGTGVGFIGAGGVTYQGVNSYSQLTAATVAIPGGMSMVESQRDSNVLQLSQYYAHGSNPGDIIEVSYAQE